MPTFSEIKQLADSLLEDAGVAGFFPVPLERVAHHLGFASLAFDGGQDISGAIKYDQRTIYVNRNEPPQRQRFTLAHEIGHAVLHAEEDVIDYRANIDMPKTRKEVEANHFAANLLMPEDAFVSVWTSRLGNVERVAKYFGVSEPAARFRAKNLGWA